MGYAFIRAAIRMGAAPEPDPRRIVRHTLASFVAPLVFGIAFLPVPLALRTFMSIGLLIVVIAGLARDLEPPRQKRH